MKMQVALFSILTLVSSLSFAQGVPNTFVAGQPARAAEVNENFTSLNDGISTNADAISENTTDIVNNETSISNNTANINSLQLTQEATYDYRDYLTASNIIEKTFTVSAGLNDLTRMTWGYTHSSDDGVPTVSVLQTRYDSTDAVIGSLFERHYRNQEDFSFYTGNTNYDAADPTTPTSEREYVNGITRYSSSFKLGDTIVDAAIRNSTTFDPAGDINESRIFQTSYLISRIEDVTVPYNGGTTYTGCLVVEIRFISIISGSRETMSTHWICPNVGVVQIARTGEGLHQLIDLTLN